MPREVADAVAVGVREAPRVDLVHDRRGPPRPPSWRPDTQAAAGRSSAASSLATAARDQAPSTHELPHVRLGQVGNRELAIGRPPRRRADGDCGRGRRHGRAAGRPHPHGARATTPRPIGWHRSARVSHSVSSWPDEVHEVYDERPVVARHDHDAPPHRTGPWLTDDVHSGEGDIEGVVVRPGPRAGGVDEPGIHQQLVVLDEEVVPTHATVRAWSCSATWLST